MKRSCEPAQHEQGLNNIVLFPPQNVPWHHGDAYLKALGDDAGFAPPASCEVMMQCIDEPRPELQGVCLLLNGEALLTAAHHCLHELMGTDLYDKWPLSGKTGLHARC